MSTEYQKIVDLKISGRRPRSRLHKLWIYQIKRDTRGEKENGARLF
jgi:hypothetical protein